MQAARAVAAGLSGGALTSFLLWGARDASELPAALPLAAGEMLGIEPGVAVSVAGHALFLVAAGAFALCYAWVFERVIGTADIRVGAVAGLVHALLAALVLLAVALIGPVLSERVAGVGAWTTAFGVEGLAAFLVLHVLYGGTVGAIYAPAIVRRPEPAPPRRPASVPVPDGAPGRTSPVRSRTLGTWPGGR